MISARCRVIIPALNEEDAIAKVIGDIPTDIVKEIIVVDNGSSDNTMQVAATAGATVLSEQYLKKNDIMRYRAIIKELNLRK